MRNGIRRAGQGGFDVRFIQPWIAIEKFGFCCSFSEFAEHNLRIGFRFEENDVFGVEWIDCR
jgi:hypothetical protein